MATFAGKQRRDHITMADKKNQHYVPRVHLRPFSINCKGLAINLFNLDRMKAIPNAAVKHQCSGDYFYGQDEQLEKAINSIENPYGEVVRRLAGDRAAIGPRERIAIKRFIYLQYLRTEAASRKASEMFYAMRDLPGSDIPMPSFREAIKEAVQIGMSLFAETMHIVDDMKLCIIRNRTGLPFVTSDDPAVLTNRLHIQRPVGRRRSFGASSAGAVYVLPLTSKLCALLYDGAVYTVDHRAHWVDAAREADIEAINEHQFLNCMANIYFRDWGGRDRVLAGAQSALPRRPARRHTVVHAILDETTKWGEHYAVRPVNDIRSGEKVLVHVASNHHRPKAWPSFLRFRTDRKAYSNDTEAGLTRRWCLEQGFVRGAGYRQVRV